MHVVFRESRGLEETATPRDIGQDPADLVVLSFSDLISRRLRPAGGAAVSSLPSLRLANLAELRHPLSVDTYIERTLSQARGILVRLIGGESYWAYGLGGPAATGEGPRHRAGGAAGRWPRRHAARCVLDPAGLDAAAAEGALRHRRAGRGASGDRAACAGARASMQGPSPAR